MYYQYHESDVSTIIANFYNKIDRNINWDTEVYENFSDMFDDIYEFDTYAAWLHLIIGCERLNISIAHKSKMEELYKIDNLKFRLFRNRVTEEDCIQYFN